MDCLVCWDVGRQVWDRHIAAHPEEGRGRCRKDLRGVPTDGPGRVYHSPSDSLPVAQLHCHPHYARPVPLRACPSHGQQSPHTASPGSPKGPPVLSRHCNLVPAASDLTPRSVDGVCKGVARAHVRQPHRRCCVLPARTLHRADVLVCHRIDAGDRTCRQACGLEIGEKCALRLARGLRCIAR